MNTNGNARTVADLVLARSVEQPTTPAVVFLADGEPASAVSMTWGELGMRMRAVAAYLASRGPAGSRAIVACPPGLDYAATFLGCMHAAWIPVPAPAPASARRDYRLGAIAADAGATLVFTTEAALNAARRAAPDLPWVASEQAQGELPVGFAAPTPGDIAFLQYTSGSTSEPKGVVVTHAALAAELEMMSAGTGFAAGETMVCWMPLYHDFGLVGQFLTTMWVGGQLVLMPPTAFLRKPSAWLRAVSHYSATVTAGPNFALDLCCRRMSGEERANVDLTALRTVACGGEPVHAETAARFAQTFAGCGLDVRALAPGYGMAESVLAITGLTPEQRPPARVPSLVVSSEGLEQGEARAPRPGETDRHVVLCGAPLGGMEVRIVNPESRRPAEFGCVGEIWVAGANVAAGYWQRAAESAEVFGARLADGTGPFLRTGDLGFMHNGSLVITGRRKELIIVRGHNHYPHDIERTALAADDALEAGAAAAFGVTVAGEERVVLVHEVSRGARRHLDAESAIARVRQAVTEVHGLVLHDCVLVEPLSVPKTSSGKVQRLACRDQWMKGELEVVARHLKPALVADADDAAESVEARTNAVLAYMATLTNRVRVAAGDDLRGSLELDSLGLVELIVNVEREFGVKFSEETVAAVATAGDVARAVTSGPSASGAVIGIGDLRDQIMARVPQIRVEVERQIGRELLVGDRWVDDFASANYLGLDLHSDVKDAIAPAVERWGVHPSWTRIVASPAIYGELERKLATYVGAPETLVFPTVTLAHAGLLPLLAGSKGAIFVDNEAHASLQDGAALAGARGAHVVVYAHGDRAALASLLAASTHTPKIIATDGVFSMSSDYEDLRALAALAKRHGARVYVDDAHGFGVVGANPNAEDPYGNGNGLVARCGLDYVADGIIYVAGLSKAFSSLAAFVTCTDAREKARFATAGTAVFSGPCPTASLASAIAGLDVVAREGAAIRSRLHALTLRLVEGARALGFTVDNHDAFPLVSVVVGKTTETITACETLWKHGILITPGLFPATPPDRGLLRFTVTAANTEAQIERALAALADVRANGTDIPVEVAA